MSSRLRRTEAAAPRRVLNAIPGNFGVKTEGEREASACKCGAFLVTSGVSPPTRRPLQEMPFPLPGNKGVEDFWAAAMPIR